MTQKNLSVKRIISLIIASTILLGFGINSYAQSSKHSNTPVIDHRGHNDPYRGHDNYHDRNKRRPPIAKIYPMENEKYNIFLSKLKSISFQKDKFVVVEVVCLNNYFTCIQVLSAMKQFNFDDDKLKVIKIMAPYILDAENVELLVEHFTFDKYKKEVRSIIIR